MIGFVTDTAVTRTAVTRTVVLRAAVREVPGSRGSAAATTSVHRGRLR